MTEPYCCYSVFDKSKPPKKQKCFWKFLTKTLTQFGFQRLYGLHCPQNYITTCFILELQEISNNVDYDVCCFSSFNTTKNILQQILFCQSVLCKFQCSLVLSFKWWHMKIYDTFSSIVLCKKNKYNTTSRNNLIQD